MKKPERKFVWDKESSLENERKHGVSFELAATVFRDPLLLVVREPAIGLPPKPVEPPEAADAAKCR
jgi:hypothetical protein